MKHIVCISCLATVVVIAGIPPSAFAAEGSDGFGVDSRWLKDAPADEYASVMQKLDEPVEVDLEYFHLSDFVDFISKTYDVSIIVDRRTVVWPDDSAPAAPSTHEPVTDGAITKLVLRNVRLAEALQHILEPLQLDYGVMPSFIWITTPENLIRETFDDLETRRYEIDPGLMEEILSLDGSSDVRTADGALVLPRILDPLTGEALSSFEYSSETGHLRVYNTSLNLRKFETYLKRKGW